MLQAGREAMYQTSLLSVCRGQAPSRLSTVGSIVGFHGVPILELLGSTHCTPRDGLLWAVFFSVSAS